MYGLLDIANENETLKWKELRYKEEMPQDG